MKETVVCIHGLGGTVFSMWPLAYRFERCGYQTAQFHYRATTNDFTNIAANFCTFMKSLPDGKRHIVSHSLGGIITRQATNMGLELFGGRIVMIAPPNAPSPIAANLAKNSLMRLLGGDSITKLGSAEFYARLPLPRGEYGIIAGDCGVTFAEPNDGTVTVASTKLPGCTDFVCLPYNHNVLLQANATFDHCLAFLRTGKFVRNVT